MSDIYDVIIIGGGPAGLSAGIYAGRGLFKAAIIEMGQLGGQAANTNEIDNYPGSVPDETGQALIHKMKAQAERFGVEIIHGEVTGVDLKGDIKSVIIGNRTIYKAKAIIIATGTKPRLLGCPGEQELTGKGVSYCATCDAAFFEDLEVFVVGGGDSAIQEALFIARFARKITIIQNLPELTASKSIQEKALSDPKFSFVYSSVVKELGGSDGLLDKIIVENVDTGKTREFIANDDDGTFGLFVFIGSIPQTEIFSGSIEMEYGYIKTDKSKCTNIRGVYAVGDCTVTELRQIVTAAADGAVAAVAIERYLDDQ